MAVGVRTCVAVGLSCIAVGAPVASAHGPDRAVPGAQVAGATTVLDGILRVSHADSAKVAAIWSGRLEVGGRSYVVQNPRVVRDFAGKRVRVRARRTGTRRIVIDPSSVRVRGVAPRAGLTRAALAVEYRRATGRPAPKVRRAHAVTGTRKVAVLLVNFQDDTTTPFTTTGARASVFTAPDSMNAYMSAMSAGRISFSGVANPQGDVFGYYTVAAGVADCDSYENWGFLARNQAFSAGVNLLAYDHVVYVFNSVCPAAGIAEQPPLPGPSANEIGQVWLFGTLDLHVVAHEFGHNLGLSHSFALDCADASLGRVSLRHPGEGAACIEREYRDPFGVMGGADTVSTADYAYELPAVQRSQLGWIDPGQTQTVTTSGTYALAPLVGAGGVKEIRIPHCSPLTGAAEHFTIEYRRPLGFDATLPAVTEGVYVRLARVQEQVNNTPYGAEPRLIDMTPLTPTFLDAALLPGQTLGDGRDGMSLGVLSVGPAGATIRVDFGPDASAPASPAPTFRPTSEVVGGAPQRITEVGKRTIPTVRLGWLPTTECIGPAASYRVMRDGVDLGTTTATEFTDPSLASTVPGAPLNYTVQALDSVGNASAPSAPITTIAPDVVAPTAASRLAVAAKKDGRHLTWAAGTDNAPNLRYAVYRGGVLVAESATTNVVDSQVFRDGTRLEYQVVAIDGAGNPSEATPPVAVTLGGVSSRLRRIAQFNLRKAGPVKLVVAKGGRKVATLRRTGKKGRNRVALPAAVVPNPGRYIVTVTQRGTKPIILSVLV